jgi:hypothetical protein
MRVEQVSVLTSFRLQMQEFFMRFERFDITACPPGWRRRGAARIS